MFFATDIRPGDAVLCTVGASPLPSASSLARLKQGRVYRVETLLQMDGEVRLRLKGDDAGYRASIFRKLRPAEPDFIRACFGKVRRPRPA